MPLILLISNGYLVSFLKSLSFPKSFELLPLFYTKYTYILESTSGLFLLIFSFASVMINCRIL